MPDRDLGDLSPTDVRFETGGKKKQVYWLHEASESAYVEHTQRMFSTVELVDEAEADEDGRVKARFRAKSGKSAEVMKERMDAEMWLLGQCVFTDEEHAKDEEGKPIGSVPAGWGHRLVKKLRETLDEISDLKDRKKPDGGESANGTGEAEAQRGATAEDRLKNSSAAMTVTSE